MSYWFRHRLMKFNPHHDSRGLFSTAEGTAIDSAAKKLFTTAQKLEPGVSKIMKAAIPSYAHLDEQGFNNRLKSHASTVRKLGKYIIKRGQTLEQATQSLKDSLRYTVILPPDKYVEGIKQTLDNLKTSGLTVSAFRNTWGTPIYQGVNVNAKTPEGQVMELQFHTPDSSTTKALNHVDYEVYREVTTTPEVKEKTNAIMKDRQSKLKVPQGAVGYSYA